MYPKSHLKTFSIHIISFISKSIQNHLNGLGNVYCIGNPNLHRTDKVWREGDERVG